MHILTELRPHQLDAIIKETPVLVQGIGTIEWHSYHLPIGLDGLVAEAISTTIAKRADALLAPLSYAATGGVPFPYTQHLPLNIIEDLYVAQWSAFAQMGIQILVCFSGHFPLLQTLCLKRAAVRVMNEQPITIWPIVEYDLSTDIDFFSDHAAYGETSLLMHIRPELVDMGAVSAAEKLDGIHGEDPRLRASAADGQRYMEHICSRAASTILRLRQEYGTFKQQEWLQALSAGVDVLAATQQARDRIGAKQTPAIFSDHWSAWCEALATGNYQEALKHAAKHMGLFGSDISYLNKSQPY